MGGSRLLLIVTAGLIAAALAGGPPARAEGSAHALNQPLLEYGFTSALITNGVRPLYVDILSAGEVINVSLCGANTTDDVRVEIYDSLLSQVFAQSLASGNVSCGNLMNAPLTTPLRYTTPAAGTYEIRLFNNNGDQLRRFDVTVTPNAVTNPDPTLRQGRLWAREWAYDTGDYTIGNSTDSDYHVLVPGGRPNTNYVWLLDLNRFAGYVYSIVANDIGVDPPNSGLSVPRAGNSVTLKYPEYMSYPAVADPPPALPPALSNLRFIDDSGQDNGISPSTTPTVQDAGYFEFDSDADGTYAIVIDVTQDGVFGGGDRLLLGLAVTGSNSVYWDGRDSLGAILPVGFYAARVQVRLGEYHFVANDVETSGGTFPGLTLFQALSDVTSVDTPVFWDDFTILGGTTTLPDGLAAARHTWGNFTGSGFGNERYIDTYTFGLVSEVNTPVVIVADDAPLSDADDDGLPDSFDDDDDDDGIPDVTEGSGDPDGDGIPNSGDIDADGDGIADNHEAQSSAGYVPPSGSDTDGDGLDNAYDADSGGIALVPINTDGSGGPDYLDTDADGDGVADAIEGHDANEDGVADNTPAGTDTDGDGLDDAYDTVAGPAAGNEVGSNAARQDTDTDGAPDWRDTDDDGDSYPTLTEDWNTNTNFADDDEDGDGTPDYLDTDGRQDSDGDGEPDVLDLDDDNDGIPDANEPPGDTDGDGTPDTLDLDADDDGIADLVEAGGADTNGDGIVDGFTDTNGDGLDDTLAGTPLPRPDTDGDGRPNFLDIDADGDGIADNHEAQASAGYVAPSGSDTDGDGLDNAYDADSGGIALVPINTDGSGGPDYLDTDADGDGVADAIEGHDANEDGVADNTPAGTDTDGDGLDDAYDTVAGPAAGNEVGSNAARQDTDTDGAPDWRDTDDDGDSYPTGTEDWNTNTNFADDDEDGDGTPDYLDTDGRQDSDDDGEPDVLDLDDDNDGVPDATEGSGDPDGDGIPNSLDIDADGDGITDNHETQSSAGYVPPSGADTDSDGLDDAYDADSGGTALVPIDTDGTGGPDYLDTDADGDGVADAIEGHDANEDGVADNTPAGTDTDGDGLDDAYDTVAGPAAGNEVGSNAARQDTDTDGAPDWRDTDDDGDSYPTGTEDWNTNTNFADDDEDGDGTPDYLDTDGRQDSDDDGEPDVLDLDDDNDGVPDATEGSGDPDGDGIPNSLDIDADGDGITDNHETQSSAGYVPPSGADTDSDGLDDAYDADSGGTALVPIDTDGTGGPDYLDTDADGDGVADAIEGHDANEDGVADNTPAGTDTDGDGLDDAYDTVAGPAAGNAAGSNAARQDTDTDGAPDWRDTDDDGDSYPTGTEDWNTNTNFADDDEDGDGTPDYLDTDGRQDSDDDGEPDVLDLDDDNDGVPDATEGSGDPDGDGIPNSLDIDADGDGITDNHETQSSAGYVAPSGADTDSDGLDDAYDADSGGTALVPIDTDGTGGPDYLDTDADGDGVADAIEGHDANEDGVADNTPAGTDTDGDGLDDAYDTVAGPAAGNAAGSNAARQDTDTDGAPDWRDTDDDGDSYPTGTEDWNTNTNFADDDEDGDGTPDYLDTDGRQDSDDDGEPDVLDLDDDNDGVPDATEGSGDPDGDGIPNSLDIDADGDGIADNHEAQSSAGYVAPSGSDTDGDGLDNAYDADSGGTALVPIDTDGSGGPDYLDTDADGDGVADAIEGHDANEDGVADNTPLGTDTDGDGLDDAYDTVAGPAAGNEAGSNAARQDTDTDGAPDWRDTDDDGDSYPTLTEDWNTNTNFADDDEDGDGTPDYLDTDGRQDLDGDGEPDVLDLDDDNDGIPDANEPPGDTDGDGTPDTLDLDADDDGIADLVEAGGADTNGDGVVDGFTDTNGDGLDDTLAGTPLPRPDTDGDGRPNFLDIDADGDGIADNHEAQASAGYVAPSGTDTDGDGLDDAYDADSGGIALVPIDTDGAGGADYLDTDADGDGVPDTIEGHDADHDGVADNTPLGTDTDGDGLDDAYDTVAGPASGNAVGSNAARQDSNIDNEPDWRDTDDDGDGTPTLGEDANGNGNRADDDEDGDGAPDYLDTPVPAGGAILLSKEVSDDRVAVGDFVAYTITAENVGGSALNSIRILDQIPAGFKYALGSARLVREGTDTVLGTADDEVAGIDPSGSRPLAFEPITFAPGESLKLTYLLIVGSGVSEGRYTNVATPYVVGGVAGNSASADVMVEQDDPIFDRTTVIGKVFHDRNANGVQDDGESGIPGVRLATATGLLIETDPHGRYHVADVNAGRWERGRNFIIEVDTSTLPGGSEITTGNPRVLHLTPGLMDKIDFGVRLPESSPSVAVATNGVGHPPETGEGDSASGASGSEPVAAEVIGVGTGGGAGPSRLALPGGASLWVTEDPGIVDPRLDLAAPARARLAPEGLEPVEFTLYSNYGAFIARWEISIHQGNDDDLVTPLARLGGSTPIGFERVTWDGRTERSVELHVGDELVYVLRVFDADGRIDETAPKRLLVVDREFEAQAGETSGEETAESYGSSSLARQTIPVRGSRVRLHGAGLTPGSTLEIDGRTVPVDRNGSVAAERMLPLGHHDFEVAVVDPESGRATHTLPLDVTGSYFFMVGIADLTAGQNDVSGHVEPLAGDERFDGSTYTDGRIAFYLKGKVRGRYLITTQLDTTEEDLGDVLGDLDQKDPRRLFRQLDPDRYYPVYGDDSTTVSDVDTQGRFYVRLDWDKSQAVWGNFATGMTGTEFAQYDRSLYGGQVRHLSLATTPSGEHRTEVMAFVSEAQSAMAHDEFLGTGGSLYYLRNTEVVQGSEKVWVEVRERDTARVVEQLPLERGRDYEFDDLQGRLILTRPLQQVADQVAPSIVRDTPLDGNDVVLLVDYEYVPPAFDPDQATYGARGRGWVNDHIGIGASYASEQRDGEDYTLGGADLTLRHGRGTYLRAEYAESEATQATSGYRSVDGGLTFAQIADPTQAGRKGDAVAVEGRVHFGELMSRDVDATAAAWIRERSAGFSTARADASIDTTEYGIEGTWRPNERLQTTARAAVVESGDSEESRASAQVDWHAAERVRVGGEVRQVEDEPAGGDAVGATLGGVRVSYEFEEGVQGYATAQTAIDQDDAYEDNDLYGVGVRAKISDRWTVDAEGGTGDRGEALRVGADYHLDAEQSLYGTYGLSTDRTDGDRGVLTVGRRAQISNQIRLFNEHQFTHGDRQAGLAHVFGLDFAPRERWKVGLALQKSDLDSTAGGGIDRDAASVSLGYSGDAARYGGKVEFRNDGGSVDREQWVTTNAVDVKLGSGLSLLGKFNLARTEDRITDRIEGRLIESSVGLAYRPIQFDRFNFLGKYTWLYDLPAPGQAPTRTDQRSNVFSAEGLYDLTARWGLGAKYALRDGELRADRDSGDWFSSAARLWVVRARYRMLEGWEGLAEYRELATDEADDARRGALAVIYRELREHVKLGVGYNFTDFSDDLTDLDYENQGWFIKIVGQM